VVSIVKRADPRRGSVGNRRMRHHETTERRVLLLGWHAVISVPPRSTLSGESHTAPTHAVPPPEGTNGLAVASLALGIIPACGGLPALVLGIVALRRVSETGQKGKGHAIAGIGLGILWMVVIAAVAVVGLPFDAERDASGRIVDGGQIPVTSARVGDCLKELPEESSVNTLSAVPCAQPHVAEVIGAFDLAEQVPFLKFANGEVDDECSRILTAYAPDAVDEVSRFYYLSQYSKDTRGQTVTCIAVHEQPRTGSLTSDSPMGT